jgi:hypothetical protein
MFLIAVSLLFESGALFSVGSMLWLSQHKMLTQEKIILWSLIGACCKVAWVYLANTMGSNAFQNELKKFFGSNVVAIHNDDSTTESPSN